MTARDLALLELDARHLPGWKRAVIPGRRKIAEPSDPRDRGLAEQIVVGVVKNLGLLQFLISHYSGRKLDRIDPAVQKILAIGLYQLRFLTRIPPAAAVDEAVGQTRRFRKASAGAFVNAVLRNSLRQPEPDWPDRAKTPEKFAAVVLSHPPAIFRKLVELIGVEDALKFCEHDNRQPPTILRLYEGKSTADLAAEGVTTQPHEQPGMVVVTPAKKPVLADWARRGIAQVQDATSAQVVPHLQLQPGQRVLDRCAGMGAKTLQMVERIGSGGWVAAVEPDERRCQALREICGARGIENVGIFQAEWTGPIAETLGGAFHRILIDVPCSNSGVLARRPEARYPPEDALPALLSLQSRILDDTADRLTPGGIMVYSTCSVWPEENEKQISAFLGRFARFRLLEQATTWPSPRTEADKYHDGGYWAAMQRAE